MQKQEYSATAETMMQDPLTREQLRTGEFLKRLLEFASTQPTSYLDHKNINAHLQHMAEKDGRLYSILRKRAADLPPQDKTYLDFARVRATLYLELQSRSESLRLLPKQEVITSMVVDDVLRNIKLGLEQRVAQGKKTQQQADEEYKKIAEEMMSTHGQSVSRLMDRQDRQRSADETNAIDEALNMLSMDSLDQNHLSGEVDRVLEVFLLLSKSNADVEADYDSILNVQSHPVWNDFIAVANRVDNTFESKWKDRRDVHLHELVSKALFEDGGFKMISPFINDEQKTKIGFGMLKKLADSIVDPKNSLQADPTDQTVIDKIKSWVDFLDANGRSVSRQLKQVREIIDQVEKGARDQAQANKKMKAINVLRLISMIGPQLAEIGGEDAVEFFEQFADQVNDVVVDRVAENIHPLLDGYFDTYSHFPEERHQEISQKLASLIYESSKSYVVGDSDQLVEVLYESLSDTELWDALGYTALPFLAHVYEQEDIVADIADSLASLTEWGQSPLDLEKLKEVGPAQQNLINALLRLVFAIRDYDPNNIVFDIDAPKEVRVYNDKGEVEVFPIDPEIIAQMNEELMNPDYLPPVEFYEKAQGYYEEMWREVYGDVPPQIYRSVDNSLNDQMQNLIRKFFTSNAHDLDNHLKDNQASDWFAKSMTSLEDFEQIKKLIESRDPEYAEKFSNDSLLSYYRFYINFILEETGGEKQIEESKILALALLRCDGNLSDAQKELAILYKLLTRHDLNNGSFRGDFNFFRSPSFEKNIYILKLINFETTRISFPISEYEKLPMQTRKLGQIFRYKGVELADVLGLNYHCAAQRALIVHSQVPSAAIGLAHSFNEKPFRLSVSGGIEPNEQSGTKAAAIALAAMDNIGFAKDVLPHIPMVEERVPAPELPGDAFLIARLSAYDAANLDLPLNQPIVIDENMSFILLEKNDGSLFVHVGSHKTIESLLGAEKYGLLDSQERFYADDSAMPVEIRRYMLDVFLQHKIDLPSGLSHISTYWQDDLSREENMEAIVSIFAKLQEASGHEYSYYNNLQFLVENNIDFPGLDKMIDDALSLDTYPGSKDFIIFLRSLYSAGRIVSLDYPVIHDLVSKSVEQNGTSYSGDLADLIASSHATDLLDFIDEHSIDTASLVSLKDWLILVEREQSGGSKHANEFLNQILHEAFTNADGESTNKLLKSIIYRLSAENFSYLVDHHFVDFSYTRDVVRNLDISENMPHAWDIYEYIQSSPELQLSEADSFPLLTKSMINRDMPPTYFPQWLQLLSELDTEHGLLYQPDVGLAIKDYFNSLDGENGRFFIQHCIKHDLVIINSVIDYESYFTKNDLAELILSDQLSDKLKWLFTSQFFRELELSDLNQQSIDQLSSINFINELKRLDIELYDYVQLFGPLLEQDSLQLVLKLTVYSNYGDPYKFKILRSLMDAGAIESLSDVPDIKHLLDSMHPEFVVFDKQGLTESDSGTIALDLFIELVLEHLTFSDLIEVVKKAQAHNSTSDYLFLESALDSNLFNRSQLEQMSGFSEESLNQLLSILNSEIKEVEIAFNNPGYKRNLCINDVVRNFNLIYHNYGDKLDNPTLHKSITTKFIQVAGITYQEYLGKGNDGLAQMKLDEALQTIDRSLFSANDREMIAELFPALAKEMFGSE